MTGRSAAGERRGPARLGPLPGRVGIAASPLDLNGARRLWPLSSICLAMPVWFLLGGAAVAWSVPAVALSLDLLRRRRITLPPGAGLLLALLGWIALSSVQVRGIQALGLFAYRFSLFASMAALYVWLWNAGERLAPTRLVTRLLATLWLVLVAFGYLAILLPHLSVAGPLQRLLPGALRADEYLQDLTSIRFAETQGFLGYDVPRPSAPMAFANGWGSTLGLLTPSFVLVWLVQAPPRWRLTGRILLLVGLVPIVVSLNRGLWLSAGVAMGYVAIRSLVAGDGRTMVRVVVGAALIVVVVTITPLWGLINDKVSGATAGDATRSSAYEEAIDYATRSPLLGHGAPVSGGDLPVAVGTHGLIWYLMVSHGFPAAALFLLWLGGVVRRGLTLRSPTGMWLTATAVVCAFQVPIYGLLPQVVLAGVVAALIARQHAALHTPALAAR